MGQVLCRQPLHQPAGGRFEAHSPGDRHEAIAGYRHHVRVAPRDGHPGDPVAHLCGGLVTGRRHDTHPVDPQAERRGLGEGAGAQAAADIGVHEVEAGGLHRDDHFARLRLGNRPFLDVQHVRRPVLRRCDESHALSFGSLGACHGTMHHSLLSTVDYIVYP